MVLPPSTPTMKFTLLVVLKVVTRGAPYACFIEHFHFPTFRMTFTLEYELLFHSNLCLKHNSSVKRYKGKEGFYLRIVLYKYLLVQYGNKA